MGRSDARTQNDPTVLAFYKNELRNPLYISTDDPGRRR